MTIAGTRFMPYPMCGTPLREFDAFDPASGTGGRWCTKRIDEGGAHEGDHSSSEPMVCGFHVGYEWSAYPKQDGADLYLKQAPCILAVGHEGRCNPDSAALVVPEGWRDVASSALIESRDTHAIHIFMANTPLHLLEVWLEEVVNRQKQTMDAARATYRDRMLAAMNMPIPTRAIAEKFMDVDELRMFERIRMLSGHRDRTSWQSVREAMDANTLRPCPRCGAAPLCACHFVETEREDPGYDA